MSIRIRRESLRKSSLGIDAIRKSITNLSEGLASIGKQSRELLKETRKSNALKRKLIRQDAEFFKRRRENALRKQREDELEASTITGVTKRTGNLIQKSTRGFLGRILDFIGILILGWALTNLPKIIKAFEKLFGLIKRVVGVFTGFIDGMKNFFTGLGTGIDNFLSVFKRFDFREDDKNIKDTFEKTQNNLTALNKDFTESITSFVIDKDIQSAGEIAEKLGIEDEEEGNNQQNNLDFDVSSADSSLKSEIVESDLIAGQEGESSELGQEIIEGQDIERRNLGGPVEADQPVIVGDAAGIDSRSAELFAPNQDGRIVSNNELEDIIARVSATPDAEETEPSEEEDEFLSFLSGLNDQDSSRGASGSSSLPSVSGTSSGMELDEEEEKGSSIQPVKTTTDDSAITPMQKRIGINLQALKKPRVTIIAANNQTSTPPQISMGGGSSTRVIMLNKQNSKKTLADLQNIKLFA
tara:strand:+ start:5027 stop:6436 length:1410 start_codon:yes stop_codon:yes gene_type:complete